MQSASLFLAGFLGTLTACSAVGGGEATQAASSPCRARVILQLTVDPAGISKEQRLATIARDTAIALKMIGEVSEAVLAVEISGMGSCESALAALRADPRVRAADLDVRRKHHEG